MFFKNLVQIVSVRQVEQMVIIGKCRIFIINGYTALLHIEALHFLIHVHVAQCINIGRRRHGVQAIVVRLFFRMDGMDLRTYSRTQSNF